MSICKSSEFPKSLHRGGAISKPQVLQDKGTSHSHEEGSCSRMETKASVMGHGRQRGQDVLKADPKQHKVRPPRH